MTYHVVRQGEDLHTIAYDRGLPDGQQLYDHPANAELKRLRPNPEILHPGDRVFIPDRDDAPASCPAGAIHQFQVRRPTRRLNLHLHDLDGNPLANAEYQLAMAGEQRRGRTTSDGAIDEALPPQIADAQLTVAGAILQLQIGHLNPLDHTDDDVSGVQGRLLNLGYDPGPVTGTLTDQTRAALRAFREAAQLPEGDEITALLCDKLQGRHGC